MSFRYYKRINLGGGIHLNLSKTGVGVSGGIPGARYSVHSSGRTVKTVGLPGTGLYYRKDTYAKKSPSSRPSPASRAARSRTAPAIASFPKAGLFAPKEDKEFVLSITAYMQGRHQAALGHLQDVMRRGGRQAHVSEELFAGMSLIALDRQAEAIPLFETVIRSHEEIPDQLMRTYKVTGQMTVEITPGVSATMPISSVAVALMLAEVYQRSDRAGDAIELVESLGSVAGHPVFALSLAELYGSAQRPDDVIRVSDDFTANEDDLTAQLLVFRAGALAEKGLNDAALAALKEAMRFPSRDKGILRQARYVRALTYEKMGRKAASRKDLERIYAEDAGFLDVAERLGQTPPPPSRPDKA